MKKLGLLLALLMLPVAAYAARGSLYHHQEQKVVREGTFTILPNMTTHVILGDDWTEIYYTGNIVDVPLPGGLLLRCLRSHSTSLTRRR